MFINKGYLYNLIFDMGTGLGIFTQRGSGYGDWKREFFPERGSGDGDGENPIPVPIPIPARGLNSIPVPVPIPAGDGDFSPMRGGATTRTGISRPVAISNSRCSTKYNIPNFFIRANYKLTLNKIHPIKMTQPKNSNQ